MTPTTTPDDRGTVEQARHELLPPIIALTSRPMVARSFVWLGVLIMDVTTGVRGVYAIRVARIATTHPVQRQDCDRQVVRTQRQDSPVSWTTQGGCAWPVPSEVHHVPVHTKTLVGSHRKRGVKPTTVVLSWALRLFSCKMHTDGVVCTPRVRVQR